MASVTELFDLEKGRLSQALQAEGDTAAAVDAARATLGRVQQAYIDQEDDASLRAEAGRLFALAQASAGLLAAPSRLDIRLRLPGEPPAAATARRVWQKSGHLLPLGLCVLVSVMLFASGNTFMILLSLAATLSVGWQALRHRTPPRATLPVPEATGTVLVDTDTLLSRLEAMCVTMDRILTQRAAELDTAADRPAWTEGQLAAVQMLWEAIQADDAVYALKAAPALLDALAQQDVRLLTFSPDTRRYFDTVPGARGGITVRPALLSGETVLARGQVTVEMG